MDATQHTHNDTDSAPDNAGQATESAAPLTDQRRFRVDFDFVNALTGTLMGRRPFLGRVAPAPAPDPELPAEAPGSGTDSREADDGPPALASDSDSGDSGSDSDASEDGDSEAGSLPSLQTVSDSSDEEADVYDSESDGSGWDEQDARDELRRGMESLGDSAESTAPYGPYTDEEDPEDWEDEDEDDFLVEADRILGADIAAQGTEMPLRSIDLLEWLMSPRRLAVDNDPQRAETLLAGLEAVSDELVRRYEKLRGGDGEAAEGCAICRDDYLIDNVHDPSELGKLNGADLTNALFELLPFHTSPPSQHYILVFPCPGRHLFHRSCLAPWLARKTTCPSCRFDIDPDSLTLRLTATMPPHLAPGVRKWEPPTVLGLEQWLAEEEKFRADGHRSECAHGAKPAAAGQRAGSRVTFAPRPRELDPWGIDSDGESIPELDLNALRAAARPANSRARPAATASRGRSPSSSRRPHASFRAPGGPPHVPSRNSHDAVVEDVFARILMLEQTLRRGASPIGRSPPIFPELLPDTGNVSDDELPPLVE